MTTQSHVSHAVTPRRTYLIGRARPNAIVGRNRESGEIALIIVGRVPRHDVRPARPRPVPADRAADGLPAARARRGVRPVQAPHVLQVVRDQPQLQAHPAPRHRVPLHRHGGRHRASTAGRSRSARRPASAGSPGSPRPSAPTRSPCSCTPTAAPSPPRSRSRAPASACATARTRRPSSTASAPCSSTWPTATASSPASRCSPAPSPPTRTPTPRTSPQRGDEQRPRLAPAVVRPAAVHGLHLQRAAPRLPRRLHALHPRTRRRGPRHGPRRPPAGRPQARPGRRPRRRHGPRADRHLRPARRGRHPGTPAARPGPARLPRPLHVRPGPPHRPHPGDDQAQRLAGRARRHGADLPPGQDPRVLHPRPLVPRHGLGEGVADDPGRRQLPGARCSSTPRT